MNILKRIKRNQLKMHRGGYFHPTYLNDKEHETIQVKWKGDKEWVRFVYDNKITAKVYLIRASTYKRVGAMVSQRCRHCDGTGYFITNCQQKEYTCKCADCDFGVTWYEYIPQTENKRHYLSVQNSRRWSPLIESYCAYMGKPPGKRRLHAAYRLAKQHLCR